MYIAQAQIQKFFVVTPLKLVDILKTNCLSKSCVWFINIFLFCEGFSFCSIDFKEKYKYKLIFEISQKIESNHKLCDHSLL